MKTIRTLEKTFAVLLAIIMLVLIFIPSRTAATEDYYHFNICPGTEEWNKLTTTEEMVAASQVPEKNLSEMSTEAIVKTIIKNPFLTGFFLADCYDIIKTNIKLFNAYAELFSRADRLEALLSVYSKEPVLSSEDLNSDSMEFFNNTYLEVLIAYTIYDGMTTDETSDSAWMINKPIIFKLADEKQAERDKYPDVYTRYSNGFYLFFEGIPEDALNIFRQSPMGETLELTR